MIEVAFKVVPRRGKLLPRRDGNHAWHVWEDEETEGGIAVSDIDPDTPGTDGTPLRRLGGDGYLVSSGGIARLRLPFRA